MIEAKFSPHRAKLYLDLAKRIAQESKDPKTQVGCVIVTPSGVVYPGYNGDYKGGPNKRRSMEAGKSGFIHAEENAIIKFDPSYNKGSRLYVTHSPCIDCAGRIINTCAITEVYYSEAYKNDTSGIDLLKSVGIYCQEIT